MILLTGAAGKTGQAVLKALLARNNQAAVCALVRSEEQADKLKRNGVTKAVIGDMNVKESYRRSMQEAKAIYHICPNMHPREKEIGRFAIEAACEQGLEHFVYHSVLHPQTEKMPHHWNKMRVEEMLFESGLDFTIIQPAPYMQNILAVIDSILSDGIYRVPYPVETKLSLLDLEDLAEVAAVVLTEAGHKGAVYEIAGTKGLSQDEVGIIIGEVLERVVTVEELPLREWRFNAEKAGLSSYQLETLLKMFDYYSRYGLIGNNNVLKWILGREPGGISAFIKRDVAVS